MPTPDLAIGRLGRATGLALLAMVVVVLVTTRIADRVDLALLDSQHQLVARFLPETVPADVVIVGIDEASLSANPEPLALWHTHLGNFFGSMALARPAAVGLDLVLPDRSYDSVVPGSDLRLLEGLVAARGATRVVLGMTTNADGTPRRIHAPFLAVLPQAATGYVLLPVEADGIVRRFGEPRTENGDRAQTLAGQMARGAGVPVREGWINYAIGPQPAYTPFSQVEAWRGAGDAASLQAAFGGRHVLVGVVTRFEDRLLQPVNLAGWESDNDRNVPGVLVQAQALKSLLHGGLLQPAPAFLAFALPLLATLAWLMRWRIGAAAGSIALSVGALYLVGLFALRLGMVIPAAVTMLTIALAIGGRYLADTLLGLRERRRLRSVFGSYVSPQLMEEILAGRVQDDLNNNLRTVAIMFADVRGFTRISERMKPRDVLEILERYLDRVTEIIHAEGGTLNCIMGDGIMAIFGAPRPMENPSEAAFSAARRILAALPALNAEFTAEGKPTLAVGIGLNVGEAIVGHVGARNRHDYSAIGDTTNVASRLEALTKAVGFPLVCSGAVAQALGYPAGLQALGEQPLPGHASIEAYGWKEAASA